LARQDGEAVNVLALSPHIAAWAKKTYPGWEVTELPRAMPMGYPEVLKNAKGDTLFLGPETPPPTPQHAALAKKQLESGYELVVSLFDNWQDPLIFFLGMMAFRRTAATERLFALWADKVETLSPWSAFAQALYEAAPMTWYAPPTWWRRDNSDKSVAVVIPCYRHEDFLGKAIESSLSQPNLAYVVVVDDGSPCVPDVLRKYVGSPVYVVRHDGNRGLPAARNSGLRVCTTTLLTSLDADDVWHKEALPNMAAAHKPTAWVVPDVQLFNDVHRRVKVNISNDAMKTLQPAHPAILFSRDAWLHAGGFDESIKAFESWDFHVRLIQAGIQPTKLNQICVRYRKQKGAGMLASIMRNKKLHLEALHARNPAFFK